MQTEGGVCGHVGQGCGLSAVGTDGVRARAGAGDSGDGDDTVEGSAEVDNAVRDNHVLLGPPSGPVPCGAS